MIEINLIPYEERRKKMELPQISFLPVVILFLGLMVTLHLSLKLVSNIKCCSLKRLNQKWEAILPEKKEADRFKEELVTMRGKVDAIDSLLQGRLSWAEKLEDLSESLIPGVWLNKLWLERRIQTVMRKGDDGEEGSTYSHVVRMLHLSGSVIASGGEETAAIGKFIRSLERNNGFFKDFSGIESASIQRSKLKDVEVMNFELICYFK